jgi:hypothetical protein
MKVNLIQKKHDKITQMFLDDIINFETFEICETYFIKNSELFTIYLN